MNIDIDDDILEQLFDESTMVEHDLMFEEVTFDLHCEMLLENGQEIEGLELPLTADGDQMAEITQMGGGDIINNVDRSNRFSNNSEVNVDEFLNANQNKNTKKKTNQDIQLLQQFLLERGEQRFMQYIPPTQLSEYISEFLLTVKKRNGEEYEPCSLRSFVSSFDRHLRSVGYHLSIMNSIEFARCREVLRVKQKQLKGQGKGNKPNAADPMDDDTIDRFYEFGCLGDKTPQSLINSLWTICTQHFGMRTGQEVHDMRWGDVQLREGSEGKYLVYDTERHTKTRQGDNCRDTRMFKPRAYEVPTKPERCPVNLYKLYKEKRPADMLDSETPFFLGVNGSYGKKTADMDWYRRQPMGINKIYAILKEMLKEAGIQSDRKLTPYSMRKQLLQKLNDNGVPAHQIVQISGHKNINSINSYSKLNPNQSKGISNILSNLPQTTSSTRPIDNQLQPQAQQSSPPRHRGRSPLATPGPMAIFGTGNHTFNGPITITFDTKSFTQTRTTLEVENSDTCSPQRKKWKRILAIESDSE